MPKCSNVEQQGLWSMEKGHVTTLWAQQHMRGKQAQHQWSRKTIQIHLVSF